MKVRQRDRLTRFPCSLRQDKLFQRQIRYRATQAFALLLGSLQFLEMF